MCFRSDPERGHSIGSGPLAEQMSKALPDLSVLFSGSGSSLTPIRDHPWVKKSLGGLISVEEKAGCRGKYLE